MVTMVMPIMVFMVLLMALIFNQRDGNGILNQNQVLKVLMPMLMLLMVLMQLILN